MINIQTFKSKIASHSFNQLLLPKDPIIIRIEIQDNRDFLVLSQKDISIVEAYNGYENCIISGEERIIQQIIDGEVKLQAAIMFQQVKVECNYRTLLLLEAIFWLNKREMSQTS